MAADGQPSVPQAPGEVPAPVTHSGRGGPPAWSRQVARRWPLVLGAALLGALAGYGASFAMPKVYTARTVLLPPQQQSSTAASALASLGSLVNLGSAGPRNVAEQYMALLRSRTVASRIVDRFQLKQLYEVDLASDAERILDGRLRVHSGKRDGLITIEVLDRLPDRAAKMANAYVEELRRLSGELSLTEAQQRRVFFETKLKEARGALTAAQLALQSSGISSATVRSEPRAAAETYTRLAGEISALEVRLQAQRVALSETAPEVRHTVAALAATRAQLAKLGTGATDAGGSNYLASYRELRYQEMLVEAYLRQFEAARVDEARDGTILQVVDPATAPERPSGPRRLVVGALTAMASAAIAIAVLIRRTRRVLR